MQNKAAWLETIPTGGYKVRISFMPINEAEAKKAQNLLLDADIKIISTTTQGPLSMDLLITPKTTASTPSILDDEAHMISTLQAYGYTVMPVFGATVPQRSQPTEGAGPLPLPPVPTLVAGVPDSPVVATEVVPASVPTEQLPKADIPDPKLGEGNPGNQNESEPVKETIN